VKEESKLGKSEGWFGSSRTVPLSPHVRDFVDVMDCREDAELGGVSIPPTRLALSGLRLVLGARGSAGSSSLPPRVDLCKPIRRVLRFQNTAGSAVNVTGTNLAGACGGTCTVVNSVLTPWASSLRIRQVIVWPAAAGFSALHWAAEATGLVPDTLIDRSIPTGIVSTGAVSFQPPKGSLAGMWRNSVDFANTLFVLQSTVGSIVDVHVDYTLSTSFAGPAITIASGVVPQVYYLALDGPVSNKYVPIALTTTA